MSFNADSFGSAGFYDAADSHRKTNGEGSRLMDVDSLSLSVVEAPARS